MLEIKREPGLLKIIEKIKDNSLKEKIKKQIRKIVSNPEIGKPMRYARKGTRELYVPPYRISYSYIKQENLLIFLDIYHKDEQ
ncbi:MAG: type II toxin-antitoxin system RelE/ParE family toxin [Nanoarchaeota archaeon]|nr:type II toxin-antitoxin system RelE/ParE family toxin [Nanoarchaeota archaeon]